MDRWIPALNGNDGTLGCHRALTGTVVGGNDGIGGGGWLSHGFALASRWRVSKHRQECLWDIQDSCYNTNYMDKKANKVHNLDVIQFLQSIEHEDFFDLVIIDPPYNIGKNFGNNSDKQSLGDYIDWSKRYLAECLRLAKPNAPIYLYGFPEILSHIAVHYPLQNQRWLAWHYTNKTVPTSQFWQRSYETILCLWHKSKPMLIVDNIREQYTPTFLKNSAGKVRKSKYCRYSDGESATTYNAHDNGALPRDVIKIPALAGGSGSRERVAFCKKCRQLVVGKDKHHHAPDNLIAHPTQKPLALTQKLILASNPKNVLIPFAGSGAECYAAKTMGVNFYATEINKDYVKLANQWLKTAP